MSPENTAHLFRKYSELYRARLSPEESAIKTWGFECEDGWFDLIDDLSAELLQLATTMGITPADCQWPEIVQVKQKFGTLRVHLTQAKSPYEDLLAGFLKRSGSVCELCGKPGETRRTGREVITTCLTHTSDESRHASAKSPVWKEFEGGEQSKQE